MRCTIPPIPIHPSEQATPNDKSFWAHRAAEHPEVREHRVAEVRAALEAGRYDSDQMLDRTIQKLFDKI